MSTCVVDAAVCYWGEILFQLINGAFQTAQVGLVLGNIMDEVKKKNRSSVKRSIDCKLEEKNQNKQ